MITLKTFDTALEAHLLKSRLENNGIPAYIFDEHIVTLNPLYNNLVGGVKLNISELDADRARKLMDEIDSKENYYDRAPGIACPRCGSPNYFSGFKTIKSTKSAVAFLISLLFIVYPLSFESVKKCKDCDFEFQ